MKFLISIIVLLSTCLSVYSQDAGIDYDSIRVYRETFYPKLTRQDSTFCLDRLQKDIDRVLSNKYIKRSEVGVAVYSLDQDKFYYKKNIDKTFTPASVTKLFTTFTAFAQLGAEYKLLTEVFTDGVIKDSVLNGNLYLIGRGDPLLSVIDMEILADEICLLGIKKVYGDVIADGSFFDDDYDRYSYSNDKDEVVRQPYISGLSIEGNYATVLVKAGTTIGSEVDVQLIPPSDYFATDVSAKVRGWGRGEAKTETDSTVLQQNESLRYGDAMVASNMDNSAVRINISSPKGDERQLFNISGWLYPNRTYSSKYRITRPDLAAAGTLKNRLLAGGTDVYGKVKSEKVLNTAKYRKLKFLAEFKRDLREVIVRTNKKSDNYLAESLFKLTGAEAGAQENTADSAREIKRRIMTDLDIPFENCRINDGSGLSRRNLLTPHAVIELLKRGAMLDFAKSFDKSLAIAGVDGTLERRFRKTAAYNNLRGKTGTLRNVSALSGYVTTLDGERLAFSIFFNGYSHSTYDAAENAIGKLLAEFFYYSVSN